MITEAEQFKSRWERAQAERRKLRDKPSYVYLHSLESTSEPHYVGIGYTVDRPWDMKARSDDHAKIGVCVSIIADDSCSEIDFSEDVAAFWEVAWIKALRDAGYELANISKGGWGLNIDWTDEMRAKASITQHSLKLGKPVDFLHTPSAVKKRAAKHSAARKGLPIPHLNNNATYEKKANTLRKLQLPAKPVVNLVTGEVFPSAKSAAEHYGVAFDDYVADSCRKHARGEVRKLRPHGYHFAYLSKDSSQYQELKFAALAAAKDTEK
jgi:hypothetical protein